MHRQREQARRERFFPLSGINTAAKPSQLATPFAYATSVGKTSSFLNGDLSTSLVVFASIYHELPEYGVGFRYYM
ncbi:hypothetical protein PRIC2_004232 [Phytophthora ramorum]